MVEFESLGVKEHGTPALTNTLNWLIDQYTNYGYTDIKIDTFNYAAQDDYNLIVTKTGTTYPNTYLIVDGHYDTRSGTGTNDNGSGIVTILEVARLLEDVVTEYSIKFINFSGEEDGLIGSTWYVNNTVMPTNMDIKLVLNIDEVGGVNGLVNSTIVCERDQSSPTAANAASYDFTDTLATCVGLYSNLLTEISYAYSSDYMPFQANEHVITGLFEKNQTTYAHTPNDFLINMDTNYVYEIAQASIGASLYFAVAYEPVGVNENLNPLNVKVYPNPVKDILTVDLGELGVNNTKLRLTNIIGKIVHEETVKNKIEKLSLKNLPSGIYTLTIESETNRYIEKIAHQK